MRKAGSVKDKNLEKTVREILKGRAKSRIYVYLIRKNGARTEQIIKGIKENLIRCDFFHYRTSNQSEIDLILEGNFGTIPIEIKASSSTSKKQLRTMENFIAENNCQYGIVINNGVEVFKLSEKIIQIPAIYL